MERETVLDDLKVLLGQRCHCISKLYCLRLLRWIHVKNIEYSAAFWSKNPRLCHRSAEKTLCFFPDYPLQLGAGFFSVCLWLDGFGACFCPHFLCANAEVC